MYKIISRIIPALLFLGGVGYVIWQIPYPESITQANIVQLLSFFIPLFLAIILTLNIVLKNIFISTSISIGVILLLFLKALDSLNLVTVVLILITVGLLTSYFRKIKKSPSTSSGLKNLTNYSKIPKLTHLRRRK